MSCILVVEVDTMHTVQYSTKLTTEQVKALKVLSEQTHIPQAVLVRQAIGLLIEELKRSKSSLNFLEVVLHHTSL